MRLRSTAVAVEENGGWLEQDGRIGGGLIEART